MKVGTGSSGNGGNKNQSIVVIVAIVVILIAVGLLARNFMGGGAIQPGPALTDSQGQPLPPGAIQDTSPSSTAPSTQPAPAPGGGPTSTP